MLKSINSIKKLVMISINPENNNLMNNAINNPMKDSCCVTICKDDLLLKNIKIQTI